MKNLKLEANILSIACLEASYWWVNWEEHYHKTLIKWNQESSSQFSRDDKTLFCNFIAKYSLQRSIPGGEKAQKQLLEKIKDAGFFDKAKTGEPFIDDFAKQNRHNDKMLISLYSKLATLINPAAYTMYDNRAKVGLARMIKGQESMSTHKSYHGFYYDWEKVYDFIKTKEALISKHKRYLETHFEIDKTLLTTEIYIRRVVDKYLWHYGGED